jgi:RNA polymerase sigma-70 factor (ECF subfamily)
VQALPGYRVTGATFRTWLFQIARNLSIDYFRRWRGHADEPLKEDAVSSAERPEATVERSLSGETLARGLAGLSEEQRDVVLMRFIEGMPLAEVAAALHKSEDSVKGLQRRALIALRAYLEQTEEKDGSTG